MRGLLKTATVLGSVVCALSALAAPAAAQGPVAVVEDIKGKVAGIEFMDYVEAGRVIKLGPKDTIVLGYLKSCWRETITGGTVVVQAEQSLTYQGTVERTKASCDQSAQGAGPTGSRPANDPAATVFRGMASRPGQQGEGPALTLYGQAPMVEVSGPDTLVIERTDKAGERYSVVLRSGTLVRGRFYDFAKADKTLSPGGSYVATYGTKKIAFRIDPSARPGSTPIVGRLLRFE